MFVKTNYQQAFCKNHGGTKCKDTYWNKVTPNKRNNTTRISPANDAYMRKEKIGKYREEKDEYSSVCDWPEGWDEHKLG